MLIKEELPACPVATTVQMIGSKWKLPSCGICFSARGASMS